MQNASLEAVTFTIPGAIGGKGRGRATVRGGHAVVYTPEKTRSQEAMVRHFASEQMRGRELLQGPLRLRVELWKLIPKSWSKAKREAAIYVTGKPDIDNQAKLIADAMNTVVYADDSQIAEVFFVRRYGANARVEVAVEPLVAA